MNLEEIVFGSEKPEDVRASGIWASNDAWSVNGQEGQFLASRMVLATAHTPRTIATSCAYLKFKLLIRKWHEERGSTSSITRMAMCPAYQSIIAMGQAALPFILHELEAEREEPDQWFWALKVITRDDPVPEEMRGDFRRMAGAWLAWADMNYAWAW